MVYDYGTKMPYTPSEEKNVMSITPSSPEKEKPPILSRCTPTFALLALVLSVVSFIFNGVLASWTYFNARMQMQTAVEQKEIAKEQADLKNWQTRFDLRHHRLTIDPVTYRLEIPIDVDGTVLGKPTIEFVNSSQRTATGLEIQWELIGTNFGSGSLDGWDTILQVTDPPRTLLSGDKFVLDQFPVQQLSIIGKPIKNNPRADLYYGYLRFKYRDSAELQMMSNIIRFEVYKDKGKSALVLLLLNPPPSPQVLKGSEVFTAPLPGPVNRKR